MTSVTTSTPRALAEAAASAVLGGVAVALLLRIFVPFWLAVLLPLCVAVAAALYRPRWRPGAAGFAIGAVVWTGVLVWTFSQISAGLDRIG